MRELFGIPQVAEVFDVSHERVRQLWRDGRTPEPFAMVGERPVWSAQQIYDWGRISRRAMKVERLTPYSIIGGEYSR